MANFEDLGLDDVLGADEEITTTTTVDVTPAIPVPTTPNDVVSAPATTSFDFGDLVGIPGVVVAPVGTEISRYPVEKAKFTKDSKALISIMTDNFIGIKLHYHEGIGSYLCFDGECCAVDGNARIRYLLPIVRYNTDKKGKPIDKKLSYQVLALANDAYQSLMDIKEMYGTVTNVNIMVTCLDEQYQKLQFLPAGECHWKRSPELINEVSEFWKKHGKDIMKPIAMPMTAEQFAQKLGGGVGVDVTQTASASDFDDVFK